MTDNTVKPAVFRGTVYYDADCGLCSGLVKKWGPLFRRRGFVFRPLTEGIAETRAPFPPQDYLREMKLQATGGDWFGGVDALLYMVTALPWLNPVARLGRLPGVHSLARAGYRVIAANRRCTGGACRVGPRPPRSRWLPLAVLPVLALAAGPHLEAWIWMWTLAFAVFAGCKWLTFRDAVFRAGERPPILRALAYLVLWPGMDADAFLFQKAVAPPAEREWAAALGKLGTGLAVVFFLVPRLLEDTPLLAGWCAMIGIVLVLHFGLFHLLALVWQRAGYRARPLMRAPVLASGLADFWGRRWNLAFHALAKTYLLQPLQRRATPAIALILTFLASGLIHELVITVPAGGGYGLPTLFFLLQGAGFFLERRPLVRRRPAVRRALAWAILVPPAAFLFPPVFVREVILPMLAAMGLN